MWEISMFTVQIVAEDICSLLNDFWHYFSITCVDVVWFGVIVWEMNRWKQRFNRFIFIFMYTRILFLKQRLRHLLPRQKQREREKKWNQFDVNWLSSTNLSYISGWIVIHVRHFGNYIITDAVMLESIYVML